MAHAVRMPKPGQATEQCTIVAWRVGEGDPVRRGDVLFEIETDKANMDVEAFDDGILLRRVVDEGATVPVNTICAWIGDAGEVVPDREESAEIGLVPAAERPIDVTAAALVADAAVTPAPGPAPASLSTTADHGEPRPRISPRARRLAAEAGIDPREVLATGPDGRVVERDVREAIAARAAAGGTAVQPLPPTGAGITVAPGRKPAPGARPTIPAGGTIGAAAAPPPPVPGASDEDEPRPLSRMRRIIAERLTQSWQTIPTFTVTVAVDVTKLLALRAELKAAGVPLTVTDFVVSAVAHTLVEFPDVNSRTDGVSIWPRRRVHVGIAVSLPAGLVVPVIRDADRLALEEIHARAVALSAAARDGTVGPDDLSGGTFTISNLGMLGVEEFSAIINPGESSILAVSAALPMAAVVADGIAIRTIMKLTLSADHRLVDGETGARFLNAIRRRLEDVEEIRRGLVNG